MTKTLFFKIKDTVDQDKRQLIELFFKDWVDDSCSNQVIYKTERIERKENLRGGPLYDDTLRADFETHEDAVILTLKGIPAEFQNYLEIIHSTP